MRARALTLAFALASPAAWAQAIDLSHGGPITITATDGLEWRQQEQMAVARGSAKATRGDITLDTDQLSARFRKKAASPGAAPTVAPTAPPVAPASGIAADDGSNEVYRIEADGHVVVSTPTDRAVGDHAVYDMDQAVLVMTGGAMKITTPNDVITARDSLEYWSQKRMAVARGDAVVLTNDGRRIGADTLVAYTSEPDPTAPKPVAQKVAAQTTGGAEDPLTASGRLKKVEAFGHVSIRTPTDTVTGDRAVYVPDSGIARLAGHVKITRGQNQLEGTEAEVNLKTGISRLLSAPGTRVEGLVLPNDPSNKGAALPGSVAGPAAAGKK